MPQVSKSGGICKLSFIARVTDTRRTLLLWYKHYFRADCHPRQGWLQSFSCEAPSPLPLSTLTKWSAICALTWHCRTVNIVFLPSSLRDGLMGQTASVCQLRLLTSDPGLNPRLLLRMLLHRDCHLSRILLENSCKSLVMLHDMYVKKNEGGVLVHLI